MVVSEGTTWGVMRPAVALGTSIQLNNESLGPNLETRLITPRLRGSLRSNWQRPSISETEGLLQ